MNTDRWPPDNLVSIQKNTPEGVRVPASQLTSTTEIHVWLCQADRLPISIDDNKWACFLSQVELQRMQALRHVSQRKSYAVAHALLRQVLSQKLNCAAQEVSFRTHPYGKPELQSAFCCENKPIHFNISHTQGMAAVAIADMPVGVDIEQHLVSRPIEMAQMLFTSEECMQVQQFAKPSLLFRRYWVMKEAITKAMGAGLSIPLQQLAIQSPTHGHKKNYRGWLHVEDISLQGSHSSNAFIVRQIVSSDEREVPWDAAVAVAMPKYDGCHAKRALLPSLRLHWMTCNNLLAGAAENQCCVPVAVQRGRPEGMAQFARHLESSKSW